MANKILQLIKKQILGNVKTTKDLIYKDKIIDPHNIRASYDSIPLKSSDDWQLSTIKYDNKCFYINWSTYIRIASMHIKLSNMLSTDYSQFFEGPINKYTDKFISSEIFHSLLVEGIKSSKKTINNLSNTWIINVSENQLLTNYKQAMNFVLSTNDISEGTLYALHTILSKDIDLGDDRLDGIPYREGEVDIGDRDKGIKANKIKETMDSIFSVISNLTHNSNVSNNSGHIFNTIFIHYVFELVHPYYDTNGRMGRLLSIWYAKKFKILPHIIFLSEAVSLFRDDIYYPAFKKSNHKTFVYDATYFVSSMSSILIGHKFIMILIMNMNENCKAKYGKQLNTFQKDVIQWLLSKDIRFYTKKQFMIGYDDMNKAQISIGLSELVKWNILESTDTKPKEYKLIWSKTLDNDFKSLKDKIMTTALK